MERDFLGLGSKTAPITVKEETSDSSKDSAPSRGVGMKWAFSSKVSAAPQFLSFKPSQEDRPRKSASDNLVRSPFMPTSVADAFDSNRKPPYSSVQAVQSFDAFMAHRAQGIRMFPNSNPPNQTITVSMSVPPLQSHLRPGGKSFIGNGINAQPLGGVPTAAPLVSVLPAPNPLVGTTDIRSASKPSGAPAQLTIFYAGSVCVYDDVSPEKAQAIMLLAGNGSPIPQTMAHPTPQVQQLVPCPPATAAYSGSNSRAATPSSTLPSRVHPISYIGSEVVGSSNSVNELSAVKTIGSLSATCNQTEPSKISAPVAVSCATNMIPAVALPQARRASLARFLEKRKERVVSTSPYSIDKQSSDCRTPLSECVSSSANSAASARLH